MSERIARTFGDLGTLFDGPHATPKRMNSGPYFLSISSLIDGRLDLTQSDHVSEEDFVKWTRRVTPQANDLLFSYETRLGEAALMPPGVQATLGRRMALIRPRTDVVSPAFLLYFYLSPQVRNLIGVHTIHGATVNRIGLSTMGKWPVEIPGLFEQRAIAEVLGALDDKIAANTKLANVSDELSSAFFHNALRHASWSGKSFADLATVSGGGTPSTKLPEYWDGDVNWATPTDVTGLEGLYLRATSRRITEAGFQACSSALHQPGAILMTSRATIGAFAIAQQPTAVNQGFIVVQPVDPKLKWWLFHEMQSRVDEFLSLANGATFLELSRGNFRKLNVRMAEESVMREFDARAGSLHDAAREALDESRTLIAIRDALLPQLMSGKLRVKDVEKVLEGVL
jgi:type I restriction enzyme S subunit